MMVVPVLFFAIAAAFLIAPWMNWRSRRQRAGKLDTHRLTPRRSLARSWCPQRPAPAGLEPTAKRISPSSSSSSSSSSFFFFFFFFF